MWSKFNLIMDILAPPCLLCGSLKNKWQSSHTGACWACWQDLPNNAHPCSVCSQPLALAPTAHANICGQCLSKPPPWQTSHCALLYLPPITALVHGFKDQQRKECGRMLSGYLWHYLQARIQTWPHLLVPMPSHPLRLRQRKFNQAQFIATFLSQKLGIKSSLQYGQRILNSRRQQGQKRRQRQQNLKRAFVASPIPMHIQRIAIIDDVMTTGASAAALSNALQKANQHRLHIEVWCVARTLSPNNKLHL